METVNITRQMERNAHLGISDVYLIEEKDGKLDFAGTMDLERVLEIVKEKVMEQKSCDVSTWNPSKPLPQLPDRDLPNYPAGVLRRRLLHRNGTFLPPAPPTQTRRRVKTDFRRKTGRSGPFFHQSG